MRIPNRFAEDVLLFMENESITQNLICSTCRHRYKPEMCEKAKIRHICPFTNKNRQFVEKIETIPQTSKEQKLLISHKQGTPLENLLRKIVKTEQK